MLESPFNSYWILSMILNKLGTIVAEFALKQLNLLLQFFLSKIVFSPKFVFVFRVFHLEFLTFGVSYVTLAYAGPEPRFSFQHHIILYLGIIFKS